MIKIRHAGLVTKNLSKSLFFWILELLHFKNSPSEKKKIIKPYTNGFTHISVTVKNIKKSYKILKKMKIKFNSKPSKSADGMVLMTYCKTPEGAFLELVQELKK